MKLTRQNWQHLTALLSPSWLSGLLIILAGLVVTVGVIAVFSLHNSTMQQQLVAWQQNKPTRQLTTPDQTLVENDKPTLKGSWPLIIVWSLVGLVSYFVTASIFQSINEAIAVKKSLGYVNAKPRAIIQSLVQRVILRLFAATIFGVLLYLFIKRVLPYSITASHASAADVVSVTGILYALLSFMAVVFTAHMLVIFLRLSLGKIRVFSDY